LRGQSVDLQAKCRRFQPMAQWKRFAFSSHAMEANCPVGRLRNGFLLCRGFRLPGLGNPEEVAAITGRS
jgi:hypothetical protein